MEYVFILLVKFATGEQHWMESASSWPTKEKCLEVARPMTREIVQEAANQTGIPAMGYFKCAIKGEQT